MTNQPSILVIDDESVEEQELDYQTLKQLGRNSIEFSFVDAATKVRLRSELDTALRAFESLRRSVP